MTAKTDAPRWAVDVSRPGTPDLSFLQTLASSIGGAGLSLLVPFAMLAVGLPLVILLRLVVEALQRIGLLH